MTTVTPPTAISMKLKFPEFADLDSSIIEFAIEEARMFVGTNWKKFQNLAVMYLAAHYVASGRAAAATGGDGSEIASESWGRFSISYKNNANANAVVDDTSTSSYGRRYEELRDVNFGGPVVV